MRSVLFAVRLMLFSLLLLVTGLLALPSALVGLTIWWQSGRTWDRREYTRGVTAAAAFGSAVYIVWLTLANPLPWLLFHVWQQHTWLLLWLFDLWLAPLCGLALMALSPSGRRSLPPKMVTQSQARAYEQEEAAEGAQALAQIKGMTTTTTRGADVSTTIHGGDTAPALEVVSSTLLPLGAYEGGELTELVQGSAFYINRDLLELHGLLIGEPKSGKTTTLLRLAAIARQCGSRVIFLDLKGSRKTAALFLATMAHLHTTDVRVYPIESYDGWRGDAQGLFNRLMQQVDQRNHPFYRSGVASTLVSLAVKAGSPPRSSTQFLERLDVEWLSTAYANDAQALREIDGLKRYIAGASLTFSGFFRGVAGGLDGRWAFEDAQACYIGIDGIAHREEAAMLGRFLLDDAAHFAVARKRPDEQVLLVIDEFGVLQSTNATNLYEQIREAGMSVYAAGQSYESFGLERDALLAASAVKILHRSGAPEPLIRYAGEREVPKFSYMVGGQSDEEELLLPTANRPDASSQSVIRPSKEYAVSIEDVQQLERGKIAVILAGRGAYVQVYPLALSQPLINAAVEYVTNTPRFTPPSPRLIQPQPTSPKPQPTTKKPQRPAQPTTKKPQPPTIPTTPPAKNDLDYFK